MKQVLLFICLFLLAFFSNAQNLRIVKDNINCSYGLKDQDGNWFVEPTYVLIEQYNTGYFLMRDFEGLGIFSPKGKQIIPCKHKILEPINRTWYIKQPNHFVHAGSPESYVFFKGIQDTSQFIINSTGQEIAVVDLDSKVSIDNDEYMLVNNAVAGRSSYLDTSGSVLLKDISGQLMSFEERDYTLVGDHYSGKLSKGNVRLIDRSGKLLINQEMDLAMVDSYGSVCFEIKGNYGVMKVTGETIIAPKYRRKIRLAFPTNQDSWIIYDTNNRVGIMRDDGKILQEPQYDEISLLQHKRRDKRYWLAKKDGLYGVLNDEGKIILPVSFDEIKVDFGSRTVGADVKMSFTVKRDGEVAVIVEDKFAAPTEWFDRIDALEEPQRYYGISVYPKYISQRNGKYGILNSDGTVLLKCIYDKYAKLLPRENRYFFSKGFEIVEYKFDARNVEPIKWKVSSKNDKEIVFTDSQYNITGIISEFGEVFVRLSIQDLSYDRIGNMMIVSRNNGNWQVMHALTQKRFELQKVRDILAFTTDIFQLRTLDNRVGVISKDGEVLVAPKYLEFRRNYKSTHLWASVESKNRGKEAWVLINENGDQVFSDTVPETFMLNKGDFLLTIDEKIGLLDTENLFWKIEPKYACMFKSVGDFYIVTEAENQKGIINSNGEVLLPFEYESIQILSSNCTGNFDCDPNEGIEARWLVRSGKKEMIIDQKGDRITSFYSIREYKKALLYDDGNFVDPFIETVRLPHQNVNKDESGNTNETVVIQQQFLQLGGTQNSILRAFPKLTYAGIEPEMRGMTAKEILEMRRSYWINSPLKDIIFDTINSDWNRDIARCSNVYGGVYGNSQSEITVQQENYYVNKYREDCSCSQHNHFRHGAYGYGFGNKFYQIKTKGASFASLAVGFEQGFDDRYLAMSQLPPLPPPSEHVNFVVRNGKAISINLDDIFPSDELLIEEFMAALQKRDDLQLDCSSMENMIAMINGKFSLTQYGVILYYPRNGYWDSSSSIEFLIPLERLQLHSESKWIVPILKTP